MHRLATNQRVRRLAVVGVVALLAVAVIMQRSTVAAAIGELRTLSAMTLVVLGALAIADRLLRAEVVRYLLPGISLVRAEVISDVGAAATKGVPLGGPLGTVLRWHIAKERNVTSVAFLAMLIASGVAAAFASWGFALVAAVADVPGRAATGVDVAIIAVAATMLVGAVVFWAGVLGTEVVKRWVVGRSSWVCSRLSAVVPDLASTDTEALIGDLWAALRRIAVRPVPLFWRTMLGQLNGLAILWIAVVALGAGTEPAFTEFARIFFVTHVLGSMVPTPGGIGVMELGLTGALVAVGVAAPTALGAVLIYRFITFLLPIIVGTVLYVAWQRRRMGRPVTTPSVDVDVDVDVDAEPGSDPATVFDDGLDVQRVAQSRKR
jgi:uncharacterized membrane protein YbhN (UPF0104 family)